MDVAGGGAHGQECPCHCPRGPGRNARPGLQLTEDKPVLWGWDLGDGRTKPPLSHAEFARATREWVGKGAAEPQ